MTPESTVPVVATTSAAYARFPRRLRAVLIGTVASTLVLAERTPTPARNPYQPPIARVADSLEQPGPRPRRVTIACSLLWISLAVGLASSAFYQPFDELAAAVVFVATVAVATAVTAVLIFFAGRRRNWARWGLLILLVVDWAEWGLFGSSSFSESAFAAVVNAVSTLVDTFSVWLLFSGQATRWFKA